MPSYVAFLRAINLGSRNRFSNDQIRRAAEAVGGSDVAVHGGTGNLRLTHGARSGAEVQEVLEQAFADEGGFEIPTVVFTTSELVALVEQGARLADEHRPTGQHYVFLHAAAPTPASIAALEGEESAGDRIVADGRAVHALLAAGVSDSRILKTRTFADLGEATGRTMKVLETLVDKWC